MDLRQYLDILKRHKWFLVQVTVTVALVAGILSALRTPLYQATAQILLRPNDPSERLDPANAARAASNDPDRLVSAQKDIAESKAVARSAARSLHGMTTKQIETQSAAGQRGASDVLEIKGSDVDPLRARDLANAVARSYIENRRLSAVVGLEKATADIETRLTDLQRRIADFDTRIGDGSAPPGATSTPKGPSNPDTNPADQVTAPGTTGLDRGGQPTTTESLKAARYAAAVQYESLFTKQQDLLVEQNLKRGEAELISLADTPTAPVSPKPKRDAALGAFVGLLLAGGISLLREQLDDRVRSSTEIEQLTGLPILAEVPFDEQVAKTTTSLPAMERPQDQLSEAMRSLRTSIHFLGVDKAVRIITVTSAGPGDGKSLVAANLATVYAQAGYRTLLISADLRRPGLDAVFAPTHSSTGLTGVLTRVSSNGSEPASAHTSLAGALVPTRVPNLTILPTGQLPPNPAELLNSTQMAELLEAAPGLADVVVIDTPPVLVVTDAAVVSARSDGVILVAALGETRRDAVKRAENALVSTGARVLGAVVNKVQLGRGGYGSYYEAFKATPPAKGRRRAAPVPDDPPSDLDTIPVEPAGRRLAVPGGMSPREVAPVPSAPPAPGRRITRAIAKVVPTAFATLGRWRKEKGFTHRHSGGSTRIFSPWVTRNPGP